MGFRIIVINSRCKLETRLNYLVVRGDVEKKVFINEINTLIVQKSVYSKLVVNGVISQAVKERVSKNLPPEGIVELLEVTENQFSKIDYLVGEKRSQVIESMERLIEI